VLETPLTRRRFTQGIAATGGLLIFSRTAKAADFNMRQLHNQPAASPLHKRLVEMWAAIKTETGGRVEVEVFPNSTLRPPAQGNAQEMLIRGELEFNTVSGNGLASLVPPAEVQTTPYAFRTREQVFRAIDGDIGDYLRSELRAKGIHMVPFGGFENGFHQFTTSTRPIRTAADLQGLKLRAPGSPAYLDFFRTYGAVTTSANISTLYAILKSGQVDAQEDPLDIVELFKLYEVQRYASITNHSWSGYNLLASLKVWEKLPADVRQIIERHARTFVRLQRQDMEEMDRHARAALPGHGMVLNEADTASFRPQLGAFYARWRKHIGERAWSLLEGHVGRLG
jgi:tripartite ATP-independent transporter DctP family solute receptor